MELERQPLCLHQALGLQSIDAHGVDVAEGSEEVGVDEELGHHRQRVGGGIVTSLVEIDMLRDHPVIQPKAPSAAAYPPPGTQRRQIARIVAREGAETL